MFSYLATDALGSATLAADASGNVQATALYAPYGGVRYSSGTMPTDYGFTGQHSDTTTGLDYYGARYYDPLAGQFTSADSVLPGDDPWSLSRYAYVAGNPLIRLDPTGHCWVVCAIVHAVTHAVKAAVKVVAVVADTTLGITSMISDVKIIFSGKTNFFQKVLAAGDLGLNAFMDVTTVIGVGEGLRAGYLGVKVAGKVGLRALGKLATHEGEDAVAHVAEHELADVAEHATTTEAKEVLLDTSVLYEEAATKGAVKDGERGVISETTWQELEANAKRKTNPLGIQRWARLWKGYLMCTTLKRQGHLGNTWSYTRRKMQAAWEMSLLAQPHW